MISKFWTYLSTLFPRTDQLIINPHRKQFKESEIEIQVGDKNKEDKEIKGESSKIMNEDRQNQNKSEPKIRFKKCATDKLIDVDQDFDEIDISESLREIQKSFAKLNLEHQKVSQLYNNAMLQCKLHPLPKFSSLSISESDKQLIEQYKRDILDVVELKYIKDKTNFPLISFVVYKEVKTAWREKKKDATTFSKKQFDGIGTLKYGSLNRLNFKSWLNDDIINIYILLLYNNTVLPNKLSYRFVNSYFFSQILPKKGLDNAIRLVKRKKFDSSHILIIPINTGSHWLFATLENSRLTIYDSLRNTSNHYSTQNYYQLIKFANQFYQRQFYLSVCQHYPQQENGYDCGVFTLMGIKDVINKQFWTFRQADINYKRVQIAHEIMEAAK